MFTEMVFLCKKSKQYKYIYKNIKFHWLIFLYHDLFHINIGIDCPINSSITISWGSLFLTPDISTQYKMNKKYYKNTKINSFDNFYIKTKNKKIIVNKAKVQEQNLFFLYQQR